MNVSKAITIDLNDPRREIVHLEQGDHASREISLTLLKDGAAYDVTSDAGGATVVKSVSYIKPNGVGGNYDTLSDSSTAAIVPGSASNIWTVRIDKRVTDVVGLAKINVQFSLASGKILHTFPIWIDVDQTAATTGTDPNAPYYQSSAFVIAGSQPSKTSAMTKAVGIDGNGVLWAEKTTLAQLGCCRHVATGSGATWTADVSGWTLTHGGYLFIYFGGDVHTNATLNVSESGSKSIWYRGERIKYGTIKEGDRCLFVYVSGTNERYDLIAIDRSAVSQDLVDIGCGYINAYIPTGGTAGAYIASKQGFAPMHGGYQIIVFTSDVPANATLNINNTGVKPIYWRASAIADTMIKTGDKCLFYYDVNNGGRYYFIASDRAGNAIRKSDQIAKTSAMTQRVGIDENGRLWVPPAEGGGGSGSDLPELNNGDLGKSLVAVVDGESGLRWDVDFAKPLIVTISLNGGSYSADVSYSDIQAAAVVNRPIIAITGEGNATYTRTNSDGAIFDQIADIGDVQSLVRYAVKSNESVTRLVVPIENLPIQDELPDLYIGDMGKALVAVDSGEDDPIWGKAFVTPLVATITESNGTFSCDLRYSQITGAVAVNRAIVAKTPYGLATYVDDNENTAEFHTIETGGGGFILHSFLISAPSVPTQAPIVNHISDNIRNSDIAAVSYSSQSLTSAQKTIARGNINAAENTTVIALSDSTYELTPVANCDYVFTSQVVSLEITSEFATTGDWIVEFDAPQNVAPTITLPSALKLPDTPTFSANKHYEINCHNGYALVAEW